jgi:hypothetical protein
MSEHRAPATMANVVMRDQETGEDHLVLVLAEPTKIPGLVVTPEVVGDRMTGNFAVTHAVSGLRLPVNSWSGIDIEQARRTADALTDIPVDWTADKESLAKQCVGHMEAIRKAIHDAEYAPPAPDDPDAPKGEGPGPYPRTEAQATAEAVARHITRQLQRRARDAWTLIKRDDPDGRRIYREHTCALVAEWALVSVLHELTKVDPMAADHAARTVWLGWESGDTTHEQVYDWAREYGLPPLPEDEDDGPPVAAGPEPDGNLPAT